MIEGPIADVCIAQEAEFNTDDTREEVPWGTLTEMTMGEKVLYWLLQHKRMWDSYPASLLRPWEDLQAPYELEKASIALVGTPINVLGGGEVKSVEPERLEIQAVKFNNEPKIKKITFVTEKI